MLFLENEAQIDRNNYGPMLFMSKQVSLPKISSILQKMKIGQNSIYAHFARRSSIINFYPLLMPIDQLIDIDCHRLVFIFMCIIFSQDFQKHGLLGHFNDENCDKIVIFFTSVIDTLWGTRWGKMSAFSQFVWIYIALNYSQKFYTDKSGNNNFILHSVWTGPVLKIGNSRNIK